MKLLTTLTPLLLAALFQIPAAAAHNLLLTLASQPPVTGTISTRSPQQRSVTVAPGHSVSFARASGRDYRLQASGGFAWTQVQQVPMDGESVVLTPVLRDDGVIEVTVDQQRKEGTQLNSFRSTVLAQPGEWVPLIGPADVQPRGSKVYGTQRLGDDSLYLLVTY